MSFSASNVALYAIACGFGSEYHGDMIFLAKICPGINMYVFRTRKLRGFHGSVTDMLKVY